MEREQYYCVTTRRFTLRCNHEDWLKRTLELYNEVLLFYYNLFLTQEEAAPGSLCGKSNQQVLRSLEVLTIVGRDKKPVPWPLPWGRIPLYFRRAAINGATGCARSCLERGRTGEADPGLAERGPGPAERGHGPAEAGPGPAERGPGPAEAGPGLAERVPGLAERESRPTEGVHRLSGPRAESFHMGVTFYKGMYRELSQDWVCLKLWTGSEWRWCGCRLKGNFIPPEAVPLSPVLVGEAGGYALMVPVRQQVRDGRKAKERMREASPICSVQFTNGDVFAVAVVLDGEGKQLASQFIRGGNEYAHRCRELTMRISRSQRAMGKENGIKAEERENKAGRAEEAVNVAEAGTKKANEAKEPEKSEESGRAANMEIEQNREPDNSRYWMKLKSIKNYHAHMVSRRIIQFSQENQAGIIILPRYDDRFRRCVMGRAGNWSPLHLSARVREQVSYKAWQAGIVVLEVNASGTSSVCSVCGERVKKVGSCYECPRGHQGSRHLNTARNLGKKCLESFGRIE